MSQISKNIYTELPSTYRRIPYFRASRIIPKQWCSCCIVLIMTSPFQAWSTTIDTKRNEGFFPSRPLSPLPLPCLPPLILKIANFPLFPPSLPKCFFPLTSPHLPPPEPSHSSLLPCPPLIFFFTGILFHYRWNKAEILEAYLCIFLLHRKSYAKHLMILSSFVLMQKKKLCTRIII